MVSLAIALALSPARAQVARPEAASTKVLAMEHVWNQAEAAKDLKALDALFDDSLVYVDSDGTLMTKAEFLAHVRTAHIEQVVTESMVVHLFQETAIVTGTYRASGFDGAKPVVRRGRFMDTWLFKDPVWVCIAAQATPVLK